MRVSTDGIICYGIFIGEDYDLPWLNNKYDGDSEDWWIYEICKYKSPIDIWDEHGHLRKDIKITQKDYDLYYSSLRNFKKEHPIPVEVVYTCSDGCTEYIIAVRGTVISASRGYPETFNPKNLKVTENQRDELVKFCKKYIHISEELLPKWYLSSYWG